MSYLARCWREKSWLRLLDSVVDIVSGKPLPRIDLKEASMAPELGTRYRRDKAA